MFETDPERARPIIHIGYHKTGSTLVQNRLFTEDVGVFSPWSQDFYDRNVMLDRPDRHWPDRVRESFEPGLEEAVERGLQPVLSCEAFSGDPWRPGQSNGYANFDAAEMLAQAFPRARVVIVHREQNAMICSLYKHSIRSHWSCDLSSFLDQRSRQRGIAPIFNLGYLEYSYLLEHYQHLFGFENVFALPFELVRDHSQWARRWSEILRLPVAASLFEVQDNPAMSALVVRGKRVANRLMPDVAEPNHTPTGYLVNTMADRIDSRLPGNARHRAERSLTERVRHVVGDHYLGDNIRLRELTGEDWTAFGYRSDPLA